MTAFNERPILHILLLAATGIGLVGAICWWLWNWLNN
jgi:hypothetical protein